MKWGGEIALFSEPVLIEILFFFERSRTSPAGLEAGNAYQSMICNEFRFASSYASAEQLPLRKFTFDQRCSIFLSQLPSARRISGKITDTFRMSRIFC